MTSTLLASTLLPESSHEIPAPEIVTLLHPRNRYSRRVAWEPPPGWEVETPKTVDALEGEAVFPSLRAGILLRELAESLVIHDAISRDMHKLNVTAAAIFLLANGRRDLGEIAGVYARRFRLDLWRAVEDVEAVTGALIEKNVLVPRRERTC
jgi:hypothetical protein